MHIGWDIVGLIMELNRKDVILCITDMFTKVVKLELINATITGEGMAQVFRDQLYREEGLPDKIYSNQGPQFVRRFMKELLWLLKVEPE